MIKLKVKPMKESTNLEFHPKVNLALLETDFELDIKRKFNGCEVYYYYFRIGDGDFVIFFDKFEPQFKKLVKKFLFRWEWEKLPLTFWEEESIKKKLWELNRGYGEYCDNLLEEKRNAF